MVRLKSIGILSYGYVAGIVSGIISFIMLLLVFPVIRSIQQAAYQLSDPVFNYGLSSQNLGIIDTIVGWGFVIAIIVIPLFTALYGFIGGCIISLLYNLVAKWTGGVELEFVKQPPVTFKKPPKKHAPKHITTPNTDTVHSDKPTMIIEEEPISNHQEEEK